MARPPHHRPAPRTARPTYNAHQALRNPWLEGPGAPLGHGPGPGPGPGSHSSGSTTYDGYIPVNDQYAPEPPQLWRQHHSTAPTTPVYEVPEGGGEGPGPHSVCTLPHRNSHHRPERPLTPGGLSQISGNLTGTPSGCGGCDAFDTWCYYCVQVVLGIAALAGLAGLIASAVLRNRKASSANLSAMPYIGAMLAIVAGALLLVQWFARNEKKRKKKRLQHMRDQRAAGGCGTLRRPAGDATDLIPLQELQKFPAGPSSFPVSQSNSAVVPSAPHLPHQFQPLLSRSTVGQQQQVRHQDVILSPSGTPWWRRQPAHPGRVVYPS